MRVTGSSLILSRSIDIDTLNLNCSGLEHLLLWLLQQKSSKLADIPDTLFKGNVDGISESLLEYFRTGKKEDALFEFSKNLRKKAYQVGTARQLLFSDVICAVVRKRVQNSAWNCLPRYSDIPSEQWSDALNKNTFMSELWPAQQLLGEKGMYHIPRF